MFSKVYSSIVCISRVCSCIVFPNLTDNCRVSQYTERVRNYTDRTVFLYVANTVVFVYNSGDEIQHSHLYLYNFAYLTWVGSDQIRSVAQLCPTLCSPMNRSTPGLPVHHQLPEFTQTHVHRVSDAIQPSHPPSFPSPPAPNPSQHQSLFQ